MKTLHMLLNVPKFEFNFVGFFCLNQLLCVEISLLQLKTRPALVCVIICNFYHTVFLLDPPAVQILEGESEVNG